MAGGISVGGIATGLDTGSIISKLVELKRRPIDLISAQKDVLDTKLSEFQTLNTKLLGFQNATASLSTADKFLTKKTAFANNSATDNNEVVSLTAGSAALAASYSLVVNSLAKTEKEISQGFASTSSEISRGSFGFSVGSQGVSITIDSSNNTLAGLKGAINNSGLDVTATIINDGSSNPYRLVISSNNTGTDSAISLAHTGVGVLGGAVTTGAILSFTENQSATNADITLDGITVTRSSNTLTDVVDGLTIDIKSIGSGTITLDSDADSVKTNISTFVSGYNDLMSFINEQLFFESATGETGVLFGNSTVIDLQSNMKEIISSQAPGLSGTFIALAQIGVKSNSNGLLEIDDGELTDAIVEDIEAVRNIFIGRGTSDTTGLTFVGFTEDTTGGTYRVRISNGQVQTATETGSYQDAVGSGNFYSGASGTNEDGLRFGLSSLADGDKGKITFSLGVAAQFDRMLDNLTDKSKEGPLRSELDTLATDIVDMQATIFEQEDRLTIEEIALTKKFSALEVFVSKMQAQGDFLANSQVGILSR